MFKRLLILLLEFGAGLAGNLAAGWVQQDAWQNLFTPTRLAATAGGAALMLLLLALLESERNLAWNWRWHRYWYLRKLAQDTTLQKGWKGEFARLMLANGRQTVVTTELLEAGKRQDMVAFLHAFLLSPKPDSRAVLVLGEPGAGKSTGLERLAWEMARQGARHLGWRSPIPVLLRLGDYQDGSLLQFAAQQMYDAVGGRNAQALSRGFETLLAAGQVVLLCDALDEALGARRDLALAEIGRFLDSRAYAATRLVVTARAREAPGGKLGELPVYTIQDLNDAAVRAFVCAYRCPEDDEDAILERLQKFGLLEAGGLGRNPFWLKRVVESGAFQGRKGQILQEAIETLLKREWDKPEAQRAGWQRRLPPETQLAETRRGLAWLAYQMSTAGLVAVELEQVENRLLPGWLAGRPNAAGLLPGDIVGLGRDAQLLVYGPGPLRFRHRLLQEALTAWTLAEDGALRQAAVTRYAGDTAWWETLLMLGHIAAQPAELAQQILQDGPDASGEPGQAEQRLFLAMGIVGSMDSVEAALRQQLLAALSRSLAQGVTDRHRVAARALAEVAWDETVAWLSDLLAEESEALQLAAVRLASAIGGNALAVVLPSWNYRLAGGVTSGHRAAVRVLAEVAWNETVTWLSDLLWDESGALQLAAIDLAVTIRNDALKGVLVSWKRKGVTEAHVENKAAVRSLTKIVRDLLQKENTALRLAAVEVAAIIGDGAWAFILEGMGHAERVNLGRFLAESGDPRLGVGCVVRDGRRIPDMAWGEEVPAGTYTIGGDSAAFERNQKKVQIKWPYRLSRYPITYAQFQCFLDAPDFDDDRWWAGMPARVKDWNDKVYPLRQLGKQAFPFANHPRECVSWYQAAAFCRWLSAQVGYIVELPHEHEWEVAARWPDNRLYPWGNDFDPEKVNTREGGIRRTTAVGIYPEGRNPTLELYDLSGNVWEWCRNKYDQPDDDRIDGSETRRVLRGGAWNFDSNLARATSRANFAPAIRYNFVGFRVVCARRPPSH